MFEPPSSPEGEVRPPYRPEWGAFGGMVELADDFNAPVPEIERAFYGEPKASPLNASRRASGP
jgi:hypothetical protein